MTHHDTLAAPRAWARTAGALYLIVILGGIFAEVFVRGELIVWGDAAATAHNILAHEQLYRAGFAAGVVILLCNVPLALIFFELLRVVERRLAMMVVFFILVGTAVEAVNLFNHLEPLILLKGAAMPAGPEAEALYARAYAPLKLFSVGYGVSLAFFGGYCLTTGYLIFRSSFLPRLLGLLLALGGAGYLVNSFALFLSPALAAGLFPAILLPAFVGETSLSLWLLLRGVDVPKWRARAD